jgi:adenylate kinase
LLQEHFGVPHVSTGDLLRAAAGKGTALGREAKRYMDRGMLVPDELLEEALQQRLQQADCSGGFILDGFPRNTAQADSLSRMLQQAEARLDRVASVRVPRETLVERLSGRRTCADCGAMWHVTLAPPQRSGVCDTCGGKLYQREDDQEDTIRARLQVYDRETAPLLERYRLQGLLQEVDGVGTREQVFRRLIRTVQGS